MKWMTDTRLSRKESEMDKNRPITVAVTYESGKVCNYKFPEVVEHYGEVDSVEWISLPASITDEESEWLFTNVGHMLLKGR